MNELIIKEAKENAGEIRNILNHAITGVSIQELCRLLALTFEEVINAIRWLAKDFNIGLANNDGELVLIGATVDSTR